MKDFDPNTVLELAKEGFSFFILMELELGSATYRYNNSDIDLYVHYNDTEYDGALHFKDQTGSYTIGNTITGGTSGATAKIEEIDNVNKILYLVDIVGTFQDDEIIYESALGSELFTDGDMETDPTNNYTTTNITLAEETGSPHGGSKALKGTLTSDAGRFYQQMVVTSEAFYSFAGWKKNDAGDTVRFQLWDATNSAWILLETYSEETSWTETAKIFQAPTGCIALDVYLQGEHNTDVIYGDDFSLKKITNSAITQGTLLTGNSMKYKYDSANLTFDKVDTSGTMGVDTVKLTVNNATLSMGAIVLSEDILGRRAKISFVCINDRTGFNYILTENEDSLLTENTIELGLNFTDLFEIIAREDLFYGLISNWGFTEGKVDIELKNELILWRKEALRLCQSSCRWEFKGTECGYTGEQDWCDQSYERCGSLGRTDYFGGFRFLPAIEEKDIWWGRSPD